MVLKNKWTFIVMSILALVIIPILAYALIPDEKIFGLHGSAWVFFIMSFVIGIYISSSYFWFKPRELIELEEE